MKKGKITMIITITLACFALALVMSMQFKIVNETDIASIENMRAAELETQLANWKSKYEETNKKYEETTLKVKEYKEKQETNVEAGELITKELLQMNTILGLTDVQGEGIIITLKDSQTEILRKLDADDLITIINALKSAGAEAISINDERITNMTDIAYINNSFIKINGQRVLAPYVIKVVGNQSYLESVLVGNGGYIDELKKLGFDIPIEKHTGIIINKYNGELKTKYIQ